MAALRSRLIATTALFTALTLALNLSPIKIPFPLAPFLYYQIWEIPIIAALLLYGLKVGVIITLINTAALIALFPGALPTGPFYNMVAVLSMLLGVTLASRIKHLASSERVLPLLLSTFLGVVSRVVVMTIMNYALLRYPPPIGFSMPEEAITPLLPIIGVFNATITLYTIPIGIIVSKAVAAKIKTLNKVALNKLAAKL
ncbi:MAG: hypothetical protein QXW32_04035 [Nitrososphaerales archaeon]